MTESSIERKRRMDRERYYLNRKEILKKQAEYYRENRAEIIERRMPYRDEYNHRRDVVAKRKKNNQLHGASYSSKYYNRNKNKINERARSKYDRDN